MSPKPSPPATRPHDGAQRPHPPSQPFQIGLLGHGTVGSAFAELLAERSEHVRRLTGRTPVLAGTLTRSQGDFAEILDGSELIVELLGGIEPARDYVLAALHAGRHVVSANKQLLSQHGEELFAAAQQHGVQLRFEAAVAGVVPVVRVLAESLAGAHIERIHGIVNGTTNFILSEMEHGCTYEEALAQAQRQGYAEADPSDDVSGRDAAAKMAILARLAFATPVHLDQVPYEGIEQLQADDLQYARELGLGLKLIGTAERRPLTGGEGKGGGAGGEGAGGERAGGEGTGGERAGGEGAGGEGAGGERAGGEGAGGEGAGGGEGLSVRVHPAFLYAGHPLASVRGPFNAVTVESPAITEITMSGPGAGGLQTASAVLGDVVSVMRPPPIAPVPLQPLPLVHDVASSFYLHMEVADRPGVLAEVARVLGDCGASIKSVVQRGLGENARLVMVIHPISQSRLQEAIARIAELDFLRSAPRAIRVIEEEFT